MQSIHKSRVVVAGRGADGQVKSDDYARQNSLDPDAVQCCGIGRKVRDAERKFFGEDYQDTGGVFTWEDGQPVHPDSIRARFKRLAAEAGLSEIRFYDLRHSYVTGAALAAGISPKVVGERVGDADVVFTLKTPAWTRRRRSAVQPIYWAAPALSTGLPVVSLAKVPKPAPIRQ